MGVDDNAPVDNDVSVDDDVSVDAPFYARMRPELASMSAYRVKGDAPSIKLDANESPWPLPDDTRAALGQSLRELQLHRYPDGRAVDLRAALADRLGVPGDQLLFGTGSDEIITMLMNAFSTDAGGQPAAVAYPAPTFVMYAITAKGQGLRPVAVPLGADFSFDERAFCEVLDREQPALAFYATPNNPTGLCIDDVVLRRVVSAHPATLHIIDEAYGPFDREVDSAAGTHTAWTRELPQVAVMGTLSKIGLAGLRVGFLHGQQRLIDELEKVRQPFNLNMTAQALASVLLREHADVLERGVQNIVAERGRVYSALSDAGFEPIPSRANFHLVRLTAEQAESLLGAGIAVRVFADDALLGWARITVGTPAENDALLSALSALD